MNTLKFIKSPYLSIRKSGGLLLAIFSTVGAAKMGLSIANAGFEPVNGNYTAQPHTTVPASFDQVCKAQGWNTAKMWSRLNGDREWYKHESNPSYVYYNQGDEKWWIDGPDGLGVYITSPTPYQTTPPDQGWNLIQKHVQNPDLPNVRAN